LASRRDHLLFVIVGISGGTGTFCKSLGGALRQYHADRFNVSLLTFRGDAKLDANRQQFDQAHALGGNVTEGLWQTFDLLPSVFRLRRAVDEIGPDLLFTIGTFSNVVASLAVDHLPVVLSEHMNMSYRLRGRLNAIPVKGFMRLAYPGRLMVVASEELADDQRQNFGATRTAVIPNGIDANIVRARAAEPAERPAYPYYIWVGRLTAQKDVFTLLRGFAQALKQGIPEHLLIVGDGEDRPELEALQRELKLEERIHFLGHVANPYPLIDSARSLILSSIFEGFAYTPIEAMALGVPVISTSCPSGPVEILGGGEFGLLVPPSDPAALGAAISRLSSDAALHAQLVERSLQRAESLNVQLMSDRYAKVFDAELRRRRG
jgi:glycosyltransferase involved in cell wall biosynthesis